MLRGTLRGDYPHLSKRKVGMMGLGVAYIVSPIDVVPDFLAILGVVDDFGVFLWLMTALLSESGQYLDWENHHLTARPEPTTGRTGPRQRFAR
jgi:uncharacterized membrane protein YkvA (DUF1232 family)